MAERIGRYAMAVLIGLAACACAGRDVPEEPSPVRFQVPETRAGHLRLIDGQLHFRPCGETDPGSPVSDLGAAEGASLVKELGGPDASVPVLVRLDGSQLQEIRHAAPEGAGCERLPPEGDVEARGNEPFWMVRVEGSTATVRTPSDPDGVTYSGGAWSRLENEGWQYRAERATGGATWSLTLELAATRCADSMSGARFPFAAVLTRGETRVTGCALEGRGAQ